MTHTKGRWRSRSTILKAAAFATAAGLLATPVLAVHSWNGYHWKRTTTQISPPVGDNVTTAWDSYLTTAVNDWNASTRTEHEGRGRNEPEHLRPARRPDRGLQL